MAKKIETEKNIEKKAEKSKVPAKTEKSSKTMAKKEKKIKLVPAKKLPGFYRKKFSEKDFEKKVLKKIKSIQRSLLIFLIIVLGLFFISSLANSNSSRNWKIYVLSIKLYPFYR